MRVQLMLIWLCVMFCLSLSQVSARLGETMEQCQARYGLPIQVPQFRPSSQSEPDPEMVNHTYHVGVYSVSILFYNNVALTISYTRPDGNSLTEDEIQHMLSINTQSSHWTIATGAFPANYQLAKQWKRDDGVAIAGFSADGRYLNIQSTKFNDAIAAVEAKAKSLKQQETQDSLNKL